jgi:hypothetical protein
MPATTDYLHFPSTATIEQVLHAYLHRPAQWWWLLISDTDAKHRVCSFGSLLPYLTGRTPHIVHNLGDCPVRLGMDPLLWVQTAALVEEALADAAVCRRRLSDLPMARFPHIEAVELEELGLSVPVWLMGQGSRAGCVTEDGVVREVFVLQYMGDPSGLPPY